MKIRDFPNILKFLDSRFRRNDTSGGFSGDPRTFSDSLFCGNDILIIILITSLCFQGCLTLRQPEKSDHEPLQSLIHAQLQDSTRIDSLQADTILTTQPPYLATPTDSRQPALKSQKGDALPTSITQTPTDTPDKRLSEAIIDTSQTDTTVQVKKTESTLDTTISYSAEEIQFDVPGRKTYLLGKAKINYKTMNLEADRITVDWKKDLMTAVGTQDTVWTDTSKTEIDTIKVRGLPTFKEDQQVMYGDLIRVNIKNKQGYVIKGRTKYGEGHYLGSELQKVSDKVMYVHNGRFTSCDLAEPHYAFTGEKMKMIVGDKVVGKPVVLRFGDVPVFALPFGVFSTKRGRRSGMIVPTYGDNSYQGRHFRNLGYYYAESEYWDARVTMDFYEKLGILARADAAYSRRYRFNGGASGSWVNQASTGGGRKQRWDLRLRHNHDLDPTMKLRVDGTFVSDGSYYSDVSTNVSQRLDQKIRSNATLTKNWEGTRSSMSINLSHDQNLITDENSQTLPSLSYRLASAPLFPSREKRKAAQKNLVYTLPEPRLDKLKLEKQEPEERWYNQITYSYSSRLENQREEKLEDDVFVENYRNGIQHSLNFNAPQNVAKYINLTPTLSYNEDWFSERRFWYYDANGNLKSRQERGFFQRRTFSTSLTSNTKFYGYFNLNLGSIRTIRHVVTPSLQFSYRPDFGVPMWGSYQQVDHRVRVDDHWELQKSTRKDRYEGSIFGGSSRGKMMSMGISLGNLFQMKRVTLNEKGEEKEEKTELFTYNTSTSYNFVADSLKFSPLTSSFRASPIRSSNKIGLLESLSIDISTRHSFYQFKYDKNTGIGREVDRFYWEESGHGLNLLRMTSFSTTSSFSLSGQSPFAPRIEKAKNERETELETGEEIENLGEEFDARFEDPSLGRGIRRGGSPWKLSGSIRYNLNLNNPRRPLETLILNNTVSLNLTKKWSFTYSTGFNLKTREVISSNLSVVRDLHCWEGRFTWSPMGLCQGFYLRLGIKTAQLRDVQLEQRRGSTSSGLGSLGF